LFTLQRRDAAATWNTLTLGQIWHGFLRKKLQSLN